MGFPEESQWVRRSVKRQAWRDDKLLEQHESINNLLVLKANFINIFIIMHIIHNSAIHLLYLQNILSLFQEVSFFAKRSEFEHLKTNIKRSRFTIL